MTQPVHHASSLAFATPDLVTLLVVTMMLVLAGFVARRLIELWEVRLTSAVAKRHTGRSKPLPALPQATGHRHPSQQT
jgi:hypothetical protein